MCGAPFVLLHQGDMHLVGAFNLDMADKIRAALVAALTHDETTDARRALHIRGFAPNRSDHYDATLRRTPR